MSKVIFFKETLEFKDAINLYYSRQAFAYKMSYIHPIKGVTRNGPLNTLKMCHNKLEYMP
jgi:hypothetical protein